MLEIYFLRLITTYIDTKVIYFMVNRNAFNFMVEIVLFKRKWDTFFIYL